METRLENIKLIKLNLDMINYAVFTFRLKVEVSNIKLESDFVLSSETRRK